MTKTVIHPMTSTEAELATALKFLLDQSITNRAAHYERGLFAFSNERTNMTSAAELQARKILAKFGA